MKKATMLRLSLFVSITAVLVLALAVPAFAGSALWNQPPTLNNASTFASEVCPSANFIRVYADDFMNADPWSIDTIYVPGATYPGPRSLPDATSLTWAIYRDSGGAPAGNPLGGGNAPFWSLTLVPSDTWVTVTADGYGNLSNSSLDLSSTPVLLPAGHWWFVFYPTLQDNSDGDFCRISTSTLIGHDAQWVYGTGSPWITETGFQWAFELDGSIATIVNQPPVAEAGGPYTGTEGSAIILDASGSSDPDGDALTYAWDLDNDGLYDDGSGVTCPVTFPDEGTYTVGLQVTDPSAATATDTVQVTVGNVTPVVNAGPDAVLPMKHGGMVFSQNGSFTDPSADTWMATVEYGDGSGVQDLALNPDKTFTLSHTYTKAGTYLVTVNVVDDDLAKGADTVTVQTAHPPKVSLPGSTSLYEGSALSLSGRFNDPASNSWTATVDYGDGSGVQPLALNANKTFALNHLYTDEGLYTVTVQVKDELGSIGTGTMRVTVRDILPKVSAGRDATLTLSGGAATLSRAGSFIDPSPDTWTATVNYGDGGGVQTLTLNPNKTFNLGHVYTKKGTYRVIVKVTDDDGTVGTATFTVRVR
jgi:hypothetical protein